ncbi:MAG: 3',5'-cyclic-nucleotide phosphodiesterase [Proteobacteria bacterium]|nr:3',5'-cyclic-nucleotide phosphodiesterase [Pseudomonadota bacterium]
MKIEILGCYGNVTSNYRATSFLINDTLLLDAGTTTEVLDDSRVHKIKNIIISHTHIDHVKGIFSLVDELAMLDREGLRLLSLKNILEIISKNLFNNLIWPDFTIIPSVKNAFVNLQEIPLEQVTLIDKIAVKPVLMTHTVYTVGYIIKEGKKGFMFTSDTGPTQRFWEVAREEKGIEYIIADVSFPNRLENMAKISGHMTLSILIEHLDRFGLENMPIYISHIKPVFLDEILKDLSQSGRKNITPLVQGSTLKI